MRHIRRQVIWIVNSYENSHIAVSYDIKSHKEPLSFNSSTLENLKNLSLLDPCEKAECTMELG